MNCGAFDTLAWTTPSEGTVAMPKQTEMLPLIVGQVDDKRTEVEDAEPVVVEEPVAASPAPPRQEEPTPDPETEGVVTPPVSDDTHQDAVSVPEAEVIVPQEQRNEEQKGAN